MCMCMLHVVAYRRIVSLRAAPPCCAPLANNARPTSHVLPDRSHNRRPRVSRGSRDAATAEVWRCSVPQLEPRQCQPAPEHSVLSASSQISSIHIHVDHTARRGGGAHASGRACIMREGRRPSAEQRVQIRWRRAESGADAPTPLPARLRSTTAPLGALSAPCPAPTSPP